MKPVGNNACQIPNSTLFHVSTQKTVDVKSREREKKWTNRMLIEYNLKYKSQQTSKDQLKIQCS